jgi:hypothetical protein
LFRFLASSDHGDQAVIVFPGHSRINVLIMLLERQIDLSFKAQFCMGVKLGLSYQVFQKRVLRRIFGPKRD